METLGDVAKHCYQFTESYLNLPERSSVIIETKNAIRLTRSYFIQDIFSKWSPLNGEISFSYNGGKDCQVLLLLYLSCLWEYFVCHAQNSQYDRKYHRFPMTKLPTVFIDLEETFSTLEEFIVSTSTRYHLSLYENQREHGITMPVAFERFLQLYPETKAIVIGIRHTDPYGEYLKPIQPTDSNWPDFIRLQPLLHWKLTNIWSFLLYSGEPISGLYGVGFTSIGSINSTMPNPHLKESNIVSRESMFEWEIKHSFQGSQSPNVSPLSSEDQKLLDSFEDRYLPGWYLTDDSLERDGRIKK